MRERTLKSKLCDAHGKTTTSMIALALERAGLDPTAVVGGRLAAFGSNARLGRGEWMVAEADESDRSFLHLSPTLAVITNIDEEHLDAYRSFDDLLGAFVEFANRVPFYGSIVACADDRHLRAIRPRFTRRVLTYGLEQDADVKGHEVLLDRLRTSCTVRRRQVEPRTGEATDLAMGRLQLSVPGRHNLLNALAAIAVGSELGLPFDTLARAAEFQGVERRFRCSARSPGDGRGHYGHHRPDRRGHRAARA
jgi:UDP-N-acetylmuramate--alanine ligase